MDADAQSELTVGSVADLEDGHLAQKVERHVADLDDVTTFVERWQAARHHVRVAYCLDLSTRATLQLWYSLSRGDPHQLVTLQCSIG